MEGKIHRRYSNLTTKGSFSGADGFIKSAKLPISSKRVRDELLKIKSYALHQPTRKNFPRRRVLVNGINQQWGMDLADIQKLSRYNKGKKYILCIIDMFSKMAWLEAIPNKSAPVVAKAIQKVFDTVGATPRRMQCDRGSEFYNSHVKNLMKKYKINMFSVESDKKCCVVERFIRTLFSKIRRYMTHNKTKKFVRNLPWFEWLYNNSYHRSIQMRPVEVNKDNEHIVFYNLYAKSFPPIFKKPKFRIGDKCLVVKTKSMFEKGTTQSYIDETFYIKQVRHTIPTTYVLRDIDGTQIKGSFYEEQLKPVNYVQ